MSAPGEQRTSTPFIRSRIYQIGMNAMAKRTSKTSAKVAKKAADNNHEESDNNHEEDEQRLEGRNRRRLSLSADRCENQGAEGLAGRDARSGPNSHQAGRPRSGRGVEVG